MILGALGSELLERGVLTGKGKMRAASTLYLSVLDRYVRVSAALGLTRKLKPLPTVAEWARDQARGER